ncbi:MAG TPA: ThuA domain-containing protein [Actinomycetes bacterium]|nr:ThuA domain-containing protein [Actinomycetes bacterium]
MSRVAVPLLLALLAPALGACVAGGPDQAPAHRPAPEPPRAARVLVLSKTAGFRHASIPAGVAAIRQLGERHGFAVDATEDAGRISGDGLDPYRAVVFLSTTGDFLDAAEQAALRRFVERGGGWVGIHAAADAERGWPWYRELAGARFARHPAVQPATIHVTDRDHPATAALPAVWQRTDEWYEFEDNPRGRVHVLATLDEATYRGGGMGADHPIAWCHTVGAGRSFYTALGHTTESFSERLFLDHLLGAIRWASGLEPGDCPAGS